jgi:hypothetical protein
LKTKASTRTTPKKDLIKQAAAKNQPSCALMRLKAGSKYLDECAVYQSMKSLVAGGRRMNAARKSRGWSMLLTWHDFHKIFHFYYKDVRTNAERIDFHDSYTLLTVND